MSSSKHAIFEQYWSIGLTRNRAGHYGPAVTAYNVADGALAEADDISYLESARFFLDFGGAVFNHSLELRDAELREHANRLFAASETISREVSDWPTNARAHIMLAKVLLSAELTERALHHAHAAMHSAQQTGDPDLRQRVEALIETIQNPRRG